MMHVGAVGDLELGPVMRQGDIRGVWAGGQIFHRGTWVLSAGEDWRATVTSPPTTKNCCSHVERKHSCCFGHNEHNENEWLLLLLTFYSRSFE